MPSSKPAFFFSSTQSVDNRLGDIFNFIWGNYAGLRELWWQVRGLKTQFPNMHASDIKNKFLGGLPIPGGIDFKKLFIQTDWSEHEKEFARWILFDVCTLYEGWAEKVCKDIFVSNYERNAKAIQFPTSNGQQFSYIIAVNEANSSVSTLMKNEFLPTLKNSYLNCWPDINQYLIAYRFFKECRNSFIHSDGVVTQTILDKHAELVTIQLTTPLLFRNNFILPSLTLGQSIELSLKDCINFATIVRKLICTLDAALSVSITSEAILEQRIRNLISNNSKWNNLPSDPVKREQRIHRILAASKIPEPQCFANMMNWMQLKGII
ncbi:hypothetical protein [Acinetobacter venetianus]|jgi:hypothetical protein|uniref:hypothetical protein n=1 Tax=Acinetobacter venetianus TaxID=52133 RepID=UPI000A9D0BE9